MLHRVDDGWLLLKLVLLDSWLESEIILHMKPTLINLDNVLPDDSSSTDVEVTTSQLYCQLYHSPDLGVSHETLLQPDSESVSLKWDKVVFIPDLIHVGGVSVVDGIALLVL